MAELHVTGTTCSLDLRLRCPHASPRPTTQRDCFASRAGHQKVDLWTHNAVSWPNPNLSGRRYNQGGITMRILLCILAVCLSRSVQKSPTASSSGWASPHTSARVRVTCLPIWI